MWLLPVPAGPTSTTFSAASIQSRLARWSKVARGTEDSASTKSSSRRVTGKPAALRRATSLEASRAAISASTSVRSSSSGAQRWTLAVWSTSGAMRRTAASFRRLRPASRSGSRTAAVRGLTHALEGIGREGPHRHRRQAGQVGTGGPWTADPRSGREDGAHVGGPEAPEGEGPLERRDEGLTAMGPLELDDDPELGGQLRRARRGRRAQEGLGHRAEVRGRPARRGSVVAGPGPASWPGRHSGRRRGSARRVPRGDGGRSRCRGGG